MSALIHGGNDCDGDVFQIHLQKDNSRPHVKFVVKGQNRKGLFRKKITAGNLIQPNEYMVREICVPKNQCVQLILRDKGNDGLCCDHGIGFYKIILQGKDSNQQVTAANVMKQKRRKRVKFGSCL